MNLTAEIAGHGVELGSGEGFEIASGKLGLDGAESFPEEIDPFGNRGEPLIGQGLEFDGAEVLDVELVLAAPVNERGVGDAQLGCDSSEGPPLRAEFHKPLDSLLIVHLWSFRDQVRSRQAAADLYRRGEPNGQC